MLEGMERLLDRFLKDHLEITNPISCDQHAFQEGKSTETALHAFTTLIEESLAQKEIAIATLLDIVGAFGNISFTETEVDRALEDRGLCTLFRRWTMSLLRDRVITYESFGTCTSVTPTRGTPQGGVLSPTLWILVINVLLKRLKQAGILVVGYADDTAIVSRGKHLSTVCDRTQRALNIVEKWCKKVKLDINPSKTELMIFTKRRNLDDFRAPKLFGKELTPSEQVKYFGVIFTPKLNWSEHIEYRINKCIRVSGCCRRAIGKTWDLNERD